MTWLGIQRRNVTARASGLAGEDLLTARRHRLVVRIFRRLRCGYGELIEVKRGQLIGNAIDSRRCVPLDRPADVPAGSYRKPLGACEARVVEPALPTHLGSGNVGVPVGDRTKAVIG